MKPMTPVGRPIILQGRDQLFYLSGKSLLYRRGTLKRNGIVCKVNQVNHFSYLKMWRRRDLPRVADLHHWVFRLSPGYVFGALLFLFHPGRAARLAALWLRPGAAVGGSRRNVQPQTWRGLGPSPVRLDPPAWHEIRSCKKRPCLLSDMP